MMEQGDTRLLIDIGELRDQNVELAQNVLNNPAAWLPSFDKALAEKVADVNPEYGRENKVYEICIRLRINVSKFGLYRRDFLWALREISARTTSPPRASMQP